MDFILKIKDALTGVDKELPKERRGSPRIVYPINGVCILDDGKAFSITITDVGLYGMRLEMPKAQQTGALLKVRVIKGQGVLALGDFEVDAIKTEVLWCRKKPQGRDFMVGVKYGDTRKNLNASWVKFIFNKFGINIGSTVQRRKDIRISSRLPLTVIPGEASKCDATGFNLGLGGILVGMKKELPHGAAMVIHLGPWKGLPLLSLRGLVVRKKLSRKADLWLLGVQFGAVSYDESRILTRYLLRVMSEAQEAGIAP